MCEDGGRTLATDLGRRIDIEVLPIDRPRIMGHASWAKAAMDAAVREADIVHVHTLWHPLNAVARRACEHHCKPYVLSPHGMLDPYSMGVHSWRKRFYFALAERRNLADAVRIVFTTTTERDLAKPILEGFHRDEIVPLGADEPPTISCAEIAARFLKKYPGGIDGQRVLFLSRLHPKKGLDALLVAMPSIIASNPDAHLFIAGSGSRSYETALKHLAGTLGLVSHVTFTGSLFGDEKWAAMAAADVFVLPSLQENFGIVVAEAMHVGLPVVISREVNISPEIAAAGAGVVLDKAQDIEALANAISHLIDHPATRRRAGENGRNLASKNYTWSTAAERYYALYDAVLTENDVPPST
jgi:glycosyltransferase involved in cell wall biosynthesis